MAFGMADTTPAHLLCSGVSGLASAVVGTPCDVVKTRMIADLTESGHDPQRRQYRHTLHCAVRTARSEGLRGMFRGLVPTYLRLAPWHMVFFVSFEQVSLAVTGHTFQTS